MNRQISHDELIRTALASARGYVFRGVAQGSEQRPYKAFVDGSNPSSTTITREITYDELMCKFELQNAVDCTFHCGIAQLVE